MGISEPFTCQHVRMYVYKWVVKDRAKARVRFVVEMACLGVFVMVCRCDGGRRNGVCII